MMMIVVMVMFIIIIVIEIIFNKMVLVCLLRLLDSVGFSTFALAP